MAKLSRNQCRSLVYRYLLNDGWLPPGTTAEGWGEVAVGELGLDDPPLPSDPHLQKRRASLDLQNLFVILGSSIPSPLSELKKVTRTLNALADWCFEHQED